LVSRLVLAAGRVHGQHAALVEQKRRERGEHALARLTVAEGGQQPLFEGRKAAVRGLPSSGRS
jgi:hypothetical protein